LHIINIVIHELILTMGYIIVTKKTINKVYQKEENKLRKRQRKGKTKLYETYNAKFIDSKISEIK
jgi:hypothetical protein